MRKSPKYTREKKQKPKEFKQSEVAYKNENTNKK
jgi:hypothetical protein